MAYKEPSFSDRAALSAQAKQRALEKLKTKPPLDPAVVAARAAAREAKEAAEAAKREAKRLAIERAKQEKLDAIEAARQAEIAAAEAAAAEKNAAIERTKMSLMEAKAARDARYAARKMRK
ncbi:MAG: DUF6481 family protein [Sphingomonas sp.]|jgi:hypothetical protein|uniref:DUF6481 family protein n=1 Tax=Sphingomonas sp. TaxID=28214 RepID=UPI00356A513B